jgi:hypothetical protein
VPAKECYARNERSVQQALKRQAIAETIVVSFLSSVVQKTSPQPVDKRFLPNSHIIVSSQVGKHSLTLAKPVLTLNSLNLNNSNILDGR